MWRTGALLAAALAIAAAATVARLRFSTDGVVRRSATTAPPQRIISLAPGITETCFALGLGDRLVGRTEHCDFPLQAHAIPAVGSLLDPNLEAIVALDPGLILVARSGKDLRGRLDAIGLPYLALPNDKLDDVFASIHLIAERCDCGAAGERLTRALRQRVAVVRTAARGTAPRRVLVSISPSRVPMQAPYVAGPGSFLGSLIELAGHTVVPADLGRDYAEVPLESVVETNPDVIIEFRGLAGEPTALAADPLTAWGTLPELQAVRDRRVYVLHGTRYVIPGPRIVDTLEELAALLRR
ncbi:MAG: helical backbone metal receptor [Phycisphaerae bacterium]